MKKTYIWLIFYLVLAGCSDTRNKQCNEDRQQPLFELLPSSKTKIDFTNTIRQTKAFNFINYLDIFNGGGVALGDYNNDGLLDIYLTSNQTTNKLYLNKGDFEFKDVTKQAGVADEEGWSTGVSVIDINNDGLLDIYVCKSGSLNNPYLRKNKLFVNQGDAIFKEEAESWGLDYAGFSIQSYFLDYDKDGDLDIYLVNHRSDFNNVRKVDKKETIVYVDEFSDQLFRNDGHTFTNVTEKAGLKNKTWGLSASIGDFDEDGWPDIYVANDFIQPDHLYINNKDGTFTDKVLEVFDHISYNSMGSDYADINNDLLPDLAVLDMLADDHLRSKENMATMDSRGFWYMVENNYHHSYMTNVMQLNQGNGNFDQVAQLMGISKTDWSWAPLIADFDNDGNKDLFVSNGIEKDLGNQDFRRNLRSMVMANPSMGIEALEEVMPGEKMSNYMFQNLGNLEFGNTSKEWGIDVPMNSNSVAYGDLDNDGDLDLVLNNSSDEAAIFKNRATSNYIKIKLIGNAKNVDAVGAKVKIKNGEEQQIKENYFVRGYQSAMKDALHFGVGTQEDISAITVVWPDSTVSILKNQKANRLLVMNQKNAIRAPSHVKEKMKQIFTEVNSADYGIDFTHSEVVYDDFKDQVLLPQKFSQLGPAIVNADINGDELDDLIISGAKKQATTAYTQLKDGTFKKLVNHGFDIEKASETIGMHLFDYDNDGDLDLYTANGSYEFQENGQQLQDQLFKNDGQGNFTKTEGLPKMLTPTKKVTSFDYDNDGDLDLFIGGRLEPKKYPLPPKSYILVNNDGIFKEVTQKVAPQFKDIGMVTDMAFSDMDKDGDKDLIVVGEWMAISIFENDEGKFTLLPVHSLKDTQGWWQSIEVVDIDNDGDDDYLIGNLGKNNKFHPTVEKPLHIYAGYLDDNRTFDMFLSKEYKGKLVPTRGKECSMEQTPFINQKFKSYKAFANSTIQDIYGTEILNESYHATVKNLNSCLLLNHEKRGFELVTLPNLAQKGPTLDFEIIDLNNDGFMDIVGVGAIHEAEVETIRYDANSGYVLLNRNGKLESIAATNFHLDKNSRSINKIIINGKTHILISNNNDDLTFFLTNHFD
ncbi:VCBS repeat-containing protein [Flagellimonas sp. 2504JD4-2]